VVVGIKSGPYEPQGSTTAKLTKDANGLWSVTLGPFEPNLYEYQFSLDGRRTRRRHAQTSDEPRKRAIAGLSMGGLQAKETGIVHLGYFRWIGAFSPGVRPAALSDEFKNALEDREKIDKNLLLFDIVVGDDDKIVGEDVTKFEDQLKQENVQHVFTLRSVQAIPQ
jgi:S-formylglutathione hydrolase FrmB